MGENSLSIILCVLVQGKHVKENLFNMFDAKHGKGIRAGFDLELTWGVLSRAHWPTRAQSRLTHRHEDLHKK